MELKKTLTSTTKVRFHDCDPFNHLNNSRYIDYIMTARSDQLLENYGMDIYQIAREQLVGWVSVQTHIAYLSPALLAEEVVISTQLLSFSDRSLLFEAVMWNNEQTIVKAVLWGRLVHVHLQTQKSQAHSAELMQFFEQVVNPLSAEINFDDRVKSLRSTH